MNAVQDITTVIIGDSTNNTLSIIRSLGEADIKQCLILKCDEDVCFVSESRYLKRCDIFHIRNINECLPILDDIKKHYSGRRVIICSFDEAAVFIDSHEKELSAYFVTPARGKQIGALFDKDVQCKLALECGLFPPKSLTYSRTDNFSDLPIDYPILLKPRNSIKGEKSDIHICHNRKEVEHALHDESHCKDFVVQEFIDKEYELDCIGVRTDKEVYIPGAVRKIRHYPPLIGAGAYGLFVPMKELDIDVKGISLFLEKAGYYGPFSVEFLHKEGKNYFMEVNFRNEGLTYAATVAGANLHALYVDTQFQINHNLVRPTYMMNYSLDFLYVKEGEITLWAWIKDFLKTRCFINFNRKDMAPTIYYYWNKVKRKFGHHFSS